MAFGEEEEGAFVFWEAWGMGTGWLGVCVWGEGEVCLDIADTLDFSPGFTGAEGVDFAAGHFSFSSSSW